jgi:lysophospholipase L1-like esterase
MSAAPLTIVFLGNSITGSIPPGGTTTPGQQACALLTTRLGATINAALAPWNGDLGGAQTTDDLPGDDTGNFAAALALAAGSPPFYHVMLGSNDARYTLNSTTLFHSNLQTICTALVATGAKVILSYDPWFNAPSGGSATALGLLQGYEPFIDALVDGVTTFAGDKSIWATYMANPGWLYDGIHPDAANGVPALASAWAAAIAPILAPFLVWTPPVPTAWPFA